MKKRFLSLLCVLALCLGLLPVTALAADAPANLYVGNIVCGKDYWTTNPDTGLLTQYTGSGGDWNVHYDPNSATLTLKDATIKTTDTYSQGAVIYAESRSSSAVSLTIELEGTNTIVCDSAYYGIYVNAEMSGESYGTNASLTITGTGSLAVSGSTHGIWVKSGSGNASLTIHNASVEANTTSTSTASAGVCVQSSIYATNSPQLSLKVDGGSLTTSGGTSSDGILFNVGSSQATGATTSLTVSDNAIVDAKNGGISAKQISNPINTDISATGSNGGIVFDGTEGTVYGNVTLQEDLEIGEGETLTVPDGSKLDCNNNLTNNGTILVSGGTVTGSLSGGSTTVTTPSISQQPTGQTVTEGTQATFSVTASDAQTYQWQQKTAASGSDWTDINSATSDSYTTEATTTSMNNYQYRCVVTSASGVSVTSAAATLTVEAYTPPTTYTISADVDPVEAGTVTVNNNGTSASVAANTSVTLDATANSGYRFTGWTSSNGDVAFADPSSESTTFTMPAGDVKVTANFEQVYTVTVSSTAGGTATADKTTAAEGETVTLTATPDSGYHFDGWRVVSGSVTIQDNKFTMPAENVEIQAIFDRNSSGGGDSDPTYSITLPSRVTGGELKLSRRYAEKGETVTLTAVPDEGYELDTLTVTDSKGNEIDLTHKGGNEYTFKMPAGRVEIEVSFREIEVELPFTDVPEGAWYADAAAYVYEHGLMAGTSATTFAPDATTSRSMIATILWRMAGSPVVNYAMDYTDVAQGQWYSEAIRWAASEGIVGGYGNGLFGTNDPITREQFAVMLWRYAQTEGYDVSIGEDTNILSYTDVADLSEYAISAMQWAVGAGIINGTGDGSTLSPHGQATRAQAAVMLMRFCEEFVPGYAPNQDVSPCWPLANRGCF